MNTDDSVSRPACNEPESGAAPFSVLPLDSNLIAKDSVAQNAVRLDSGERNSGSKFCCLGENPHDYHVTLLRVTGILCIAFAAIELWLGRYVATFFTNFTVGVWWAVIPVMAAGVSAMCPTTILRLFIVSGLALCSTVIALVGVYNEGVATKTVRSIVACGSQSSSTAPLVYYGVTDTYNGFVDVCVASARRSTTFHYNSCYCTIQSGSYCGELTPSGASNCGSIFMTFQTFLIDSTVICSMAALSALILTIISCSVIMCPGRVGGVRHADAVATPDPEFGVGSVELKNQDL